VRRDIVVVGGGLVGRLLAWRAARTGLRVSLYEPGNRLGENSAAWVAAGMIAPAAGPSPAAGDCHNVAVLACTCKPVADSC
jgi:glycine oxidase